MLIRDIHRTPEYPGLPPPGGAGHLAVAVHREPAGEHGVVGVLAAREDRGDARPDRTLPHNELAASRHEGPVADFDAAHIGDGVEGPGRAFERDAQVPAALGLLAMG